MIVPGNFKIFDEMTEREDPHRIVRSWSELSKKASLFSAMYPPRSKLLGDILNPFYCDWLKVQRCFLAEFPQHLTQIPSFRDYKESCYSSFFGLGISLGYIKREEETTIRCVYPRCPGTTFELLVCEKCLAYGQVTPYCSRLCQAK